MTNGFPKLHIYSADTQIPEHYYYQAQSFSRIFWSDGDFYDMELGLREPMIHFVLAKDKQLISYAEVVWTDVEFEGQFYQCYGISGVMTFPAFRKRGYGGQVVQAATSHIKSQTPADFALLWTEPHNQSFYEKHGWEVMPKLTTLAGDPSNPESDDSEPPMMMFITHKGKQARAKLQYGQLYVGEELW